MVGFQQSIYQVSEDERYVNVCVLISNEPAGGIVIPVQIEVEFEAQVFKPGICYIMVILSIAVRDVDNFSKLSESLENLLLFCYTTIHKV